MGMCVTSVDIHGVTRSAAFRFRLGVCTVSTCVALLTGSRPPALATASPASVAASPAPTHSPQPAAAAPSDPCGGAALLLATIDRPTTGYSTCAVPKGSLILEDGYQTMFQGGRSANVTAVYPQGFERVGIADRLEVDLIGPNFNRMRAGSTVTTGYSDLGLGFKYELPQSGRFTYAFDGLFTAATGSGGFSDGEPSQTLDADIAYSLSPAMGLATTFAGSSTANGARYGSFEPSIVVTAQIPNDYQFFAEFVGVTKIAPQGGGRTYTDFGVQKLLGRNIDVDAEYGVDFTPVAGSRFNYFGMGFGLRVR